MEMEYNYDNVKKELTLNLKGEIDCSNCKALKTIIDGYILRYEPKTVIINMANVNFMDSSGIGLITGRYNTCKLIYAKLTILNCKASIKKLLSLSSIARNIEIRG